MATHDIDKFVDGNGDEFNFRDSTKEAVANKVTSVRATSSASDDKYPSEKAVASALDGKANTSLDNVTAASLANLYSKTDGYANHSSLVNGYGLLATIDTTNFSGYSDIHVFLELYDIQSNLNTTGHRTVSISIRNNSASTSAGSYIYKINQIIHSPVNSLFSIEAYRTGDDNLRIYSVGMGSSYYGGMLCKLVSCTGWQGSSLYNRITLGRGSASSTAPSGTQVNITTTIDPTVDDIATEFRSIAQDASKGANLVVNGQGQMETTYNWPNFTYNGADCVNGSAGSFYRTHSSTSSLLFASTEYITVDCTKKSYYSADVKYTGQSANKNLYLVALMYDIDKLEIRAEYVMYGTGTLTTLAQDLNPGDQIIHLTSVDNWSTEISQTYQRGFIFWNYTNSKGYTYPPETYSRNLYTNWFDSAESINTTNKTITLNKAWTGPKIVSGTKVSKCNSGGTYVYVASRTITPAENGTWFKLKGSLRGFDTTGTGPIKYRQGTAFIKPAFLVYCGTDIYFHFTNYKVYEVPDESDKLATSRKLAVSLSNTSTDTSFDGSADVTNIKVGGTLHIANGGTGATTKKAAEYAINSGMPEATSQPGNDYQFVFSRVGSDQSATNGVFLYRKASLIWSWIKGKLTSDSGVDISGNAATATDLATNSVLSVGKGGTGKSSVTIGNYFVGAGTSALTEKTPKDVANNVLPALDSGTDNVYGTDLIVASNHNSGQTDNTKFVRRTAEKLWNYIKDQISSVLGLSTTGYTGNAATATTATTAAGYTNDGAIATALSGKYEKPSTGIPKTDLASAVQTSLGKADTAVQPGDLGTAAAKNVPTSGNASDTQVVMGNDTRLTDFFSISKTTTTGGVVDNTTYAAISAAIAAGRMVYLVLNGNPLYRYVDTASGSLWFYSPFEELSISTSVNSAGTGHDFNIEPKADATLSAASENSVQNKAVAAAFNSLATVATSGSYSDLSGKPSIPSSPSDIGAAASEKSLAIGGTAAVGVKFATTTAQGASDVVYGVFSFSRLNMPTGIFQLSKNANKPAAGIVQIRHITKSNQAGVPDTSGLGARITIFQSDFIGDFKVYYKVDGNNVDWYLVSNPSMTYSRIGVALIHCGRSESGTLTPVDMSSIASTSGLTLLDATYKTPLIAATAQGVGSNTRPCYVDENGRIQACTDLINVVSSIDTSNMQEGVLYVM